MAEELVEGHNCGECTHNGYCWIQDKELTPENRRQDWVFARLVNHSYGNGDTDWIVSEFSSIERAQEIADHGNGLGYVIEVEEITKEEYDEAISMRVLLDAAMVGLDIDIADVD